MKYNYKEYRAMTVFDTPMKFQQEIAITSRIFELLNKNNYDDLEKFINDNQTLQDFIKKQNMNIVLRHFGNTLKEEDYVKILNNLRELTKKKQEFEAENIKTADIDDKQYNSFKGEDKTYYLDNSTNSDKKIEDEMKDLQSKDENFQTIDSKKNTENMFKELETKKESLNLRSLEEINYDNLNEDQKAIIDVVKDYQDALGYPLRVDIERGLIVDKDDNIRKINYNTGNVTITSDENNYQQETVIETKVPQKSLVMSPNTIYSN